MRAPVSNREQYTIRKAGYRPSGRLMDMLRRRHPTVRLMWASDIERWALVQVDGETPHLIVVLRGPDDEYVAPDYENTIELLDRISPYEITCQAEITEWLRRNTDQQNEEASAAHAKRAEERFQGGHDLMWWGLGRAGVVANRVVTSSIQPKAIHRSEV